MQVFLKQYFGSLAQFITFSLTVVCKISVLDGEVTGKCEIAGSQLTNRNVFTKIIGETRKGAVKLLCIPL